MYIIYRAASTAPSRGVPAETRTIGAVEMCTVYVAPRAARTLSKHCCVVNVSELLRALILRASALPLVYTRTGRDGRVMQMILDEIEVSKTLPLHLPTPRHQRLTQLCAMITGRTNGTQTLGELVKKLGMSQRTAKRPFMRETGMTFSRWRQQARLLTALTELASEHSVKQVAFRCGLPVAKRVLEHVSIDVRNDGPPVFNRFTGFGATAATTAVI